MKRTFVFILLFLVIQYSYAAESIITDLIINDGSSREIETIVEGEKMYLPCKFILNFLDIPFKENHVDKTLSCQGALLKNNSVYIDGVKQNYKVFFRKNGISGLTNEYFIPAEALSQITKENITTDESQLLAYLESEKFKPQEKDPCGSSFISSNNEPPKAQAYEDVTFPAKKGWISLDNMAVTNNMLSDSYAQVYKANKTNSCMFTNNAKITLNGKLNSGTYKLDLGTNTYTNNLFSFSGISPQYKNRFADYDYNLGKVDNWDFGKSSIGSDILGFQIKDHINAITNYQSIKGFADPKSTVKVYLNDDFEQELSTYGGYYSLKDVYYKNQEKVVKKVRIEEIHPDGTKKEILSKTIDSPLEKPVPPHDVILGMSGLQNRLWASNGYIYQSNAKKLVMGAKYKTNINDKLSFQNFFMSDKISSLPLGTNWGQSVVSNRKYLNFTTMRNLNMLEGITYMGLLSYKHNEKSHSDLYFGASNSLARDTITPDGSGTSVNYENTYQFNQNNSLKSSLYYFSPQFYSAGSSYGGGSFTSDKVGASVTGNTKVKILNFSGSVAKYNSNMAHYYDGGVIGFNEYNFMTRANFKKLPSLAFKVNAKNGSNRLGEIASNSCELSSNKKIKCFNLNAGIRKNDYSNKYSGGDYSSYKSEYSDIYTNFSTPIGKKFGNAGMEHEIVETRSDSSIDKYNIIRFNYSTPTIKSVNLNFMTGYHYTGLNKGLDFGLGIMKRLKSGSVISINYRFNRTPGYIIDNMYLPSNMRHSITFDFSELYGLSDHKFQAVGTNSLNKGYLEASAFLDVNQNGVWDEGEIPIESIPLKLKAESSPILTCKNGTTKLKSIDAGIQRVEVYEEELPTFLAVHNKTNPSRLIKISENEKTSVAFGLISSVGNINGAVSIKDEYDRPMQFQDLVVSVYDQNKKEVAYTNLNEDGTYSFSGLNPGKYTVGIDQGFLENYHISPNKDTENLTVEIPQEYKDYVNIDNVNLNYTYKI
jgi:hypothetical protein